ncbi:DUF742 domain-containing protein [Antrihabitans spumae]|uniref:DUF742 domain-containing protein n=1 Tax=Antrihabitans spumae TaxID=3373370 RepID=A0ABW7K8X5_9NOCA
MTVSSSAGSGGPGGSGGPNLARPYTLTGGRTRSSIDLPLEAALETTAEASSHQWAPGDLRADIVELCKRSPSVAEVSALLSIPIGVARVLLGDLVMSSHLRVHATLTERSTVSERRILIERTLGGLLAL